ncbi:hypothetical protein FOA52_016244 [Chlamydomonas sp. UWO 241]|nr:hypothetical protein FOA52_016244 [Chlamydomonas sp. UWO 241]
MVETQQKKQVSYFYDEEIGNFCYGGGNPMRPHRARLVFSLVNSYGLGKQMEVFRPQPRTYDQLTEFHADEYISFLKTISPHNVEEYMGQLRRFNIGLAGEADCPVFDGLFQYCQTYCGGSVDGAASLASGKADIAFNWSGGMHHAKKAEASGFCYCNDIVLGILELLKVHGRVLYVDIDIHHGDGVEEAFYLTDRVMTVSFHKYGEFFPGTGAIEDTGTGKGNGYTVNVPLKDGMDDSSYKMVFEPVMAKVMEMFQPGAIVMCCGADSLSGDRLGCFNLSMEGHGACLEFLKKYNVPMLVLGGGGYTLRNVARCWTYETGRLMGVDLPDALPESALNEYNYYLDTQRLRIAVSNMKNTNTRDELEEVKLKVLQHLCSLPAVPSAHMAYQPALHERQDLPEEDPDVRGGGQLHDEHRRERAGDESDDEQMMDRPEGAGAAAVAVKDEAGGGAAAGEAGAATREAVAAGEGGGADAPVHAAAAVAAPVDYMAAANLESSEALRRSPPPGFSASTAAAAAPAHPEPAAPGPTAAPADEAAEPVYSAMLDKSDSMPSLGPSASMPTLDPAPSDGDSWQL